MMIKQLSLFLENTPGRIQEPCRLLAGAGVNIRTLTLADTQQFGILRLIVSDWEKGRQVLQDAGYVVNVTEVVAVEVDDRPGAPPRQPNQYLPGDVDRYAFDARKGQDLVIAVSARDVLTLPQEAIQTIGGESVVFVREGADRFVARPVEVGDRVGARRAVLRGLNGSEAVAVAGAFNLKAELLKSTLSGE